MRNIIIKTIILAFLMPLAASAELNDNFVRDSAGNVVHNSTGKDVRFGGFVNEEESKQTTKENTEYNVSKTFYFNFDSKKLSDDNIVLLSDFVKEAKDKSTKIHMVKIEGYADKLGATKYNLKLSIDRANNVAKHMHNMAPELKAFGHGNGVSFTSICTSLKGIELKECLYKDRKVEVTLSLSK